MDLDHNDKGMPIGRYVFIGFGVIAGYFLITEHQAHLYGWLASYGIWLLLLVCPLMHFFMPHGHGGGHGHASHSENPDEKKSIPRAQIGRIARSKK